MDDNLERSGMIIKIKSLVIFLHCWWFGHEPDYSSQVFDDDPDDYGWHVPCNRCGLWDIEYYELVTGSRSYKVKQFFKYWLFRRWCPEKCKTCKKRYGCDEDNCIPF